MTPEDIETKLRRAAEVDDRLTRELDAVTTEIADSLVSRAHEIYRASCKARGFGSGNTFSDQVRALAVAVAEELAKQRVIP